MATVASRTRGSQDVAMPSYLPRVVIVDDDLWIREGRAAALRACGTVDIVATADHPTAQSAVALWDDVDVVIVDAWDHRAGFDHFPGVAVVEQVRRHRRPDQTTVIVVTGHVVNMMLRARMTEAGADFLYGHDDVADLDDLIGIIFQPDPCRSPAVSPADLARMGIAPGSRPNAALTWVRTHDLTNAFDAESQKALGISRRAIMHIRREIGTLARVTDQTTSGREHDLLWPEWRTVVQFINRVRGADEHTRRTDGTP